MSSRSIATQLRILPRSPALHHRIPPPARPPPPSRTSPFACRSYSATQSQPSDTVGQEDVAGQAGDPSRRSTEFEAFREQAEKTEASLREKIKEQEKDTLYHRAELQTLSRRIIEERSKASEFAIMSFARSLLSTNDVLSTALLHVPKPIEPTNTALRELHNGVELTQRALLKTFEQNGVVKMEVGRGAVFDPNLHEATFQVPKEVAGDKGGGGSWGPGQVVEVGKEGWMIGNRVLRPAQVGVTQVE